ncbi:MAG: DUF1501 domain-containing protein [Pirellulales bacterium]|nr:DUF1501 domain-containing protein [Pirellulales bacterium]
MLTSSRIESFAPQQTIDLQCEPPITDSAAHTEFTASRREFLHRAGGGIGLLALADMLQSNKLVADDRSAAAANSSFPSHLSPLAPRPAPLPVRARSVIWCFIDGGPSHLDLFDPKPELVKLSGQPLPASFARPMTAMGKTANTPLLASRRTFKQHGQSGIWVSDWYSEIASCVDDIAVIRSCWADGLTHVSSVGQMNTGTIFAGRPCLGSWALYGLGSECDNLPGFVVLADYPDDPPGGNRQWSTGFMPATYQGTKFRSGKVPVLHVAPPEGYADNRQRRVLQFVQQLNRHHQLPRGDDSNLEARIASLELAYRMQSAAPEATDLASESADTIALYGIDQKETESNGRNCLLARRLVERGVRFVQLYMGSGSKWDAHSDVEGNHSQYCKETDRPIAGLLRDLKQRGLLDSTLVIWGGEFGRTPMSESGSGRDHNPYGFTLWMAGGGVKGGVTYGATDEIGLYAVENKAHIHDIHATILALMGLDHEQLTFRNNGRDERLTVTSGEVIRNIFA